MEASTKLHPDIPLAASWCVRTHDLLIEPPHLSRRGRRSAINTFLNDRNVDSTNSITYALRCAATSLEVTVRRSPARGYPCAMLNSMALGRASGLWGKLLLKDFIHAQSWTRRAWYERAWCWWSQRDLNPCFNHAHVFAMFSDLLNDFEL